MYIEVSREHLNNKAGIAKDFIMTDERESKGHKVPINNIHVVFRRIVRVQHIMTQSVMLPMLLPITVISLLFGHKNFPFVCTLHHTSRVSFS